jgi:hypothetical protein
MRCRPTHYIFLEAEKLVTLLQMNKMNNEPTGEKTFAAAQTGAGVQHSRRLLTVSCAVSNHLS